jgi:hypothetical protein
MAVTATSLDGGRIRQEREKGNDALLACCYGCFCFPTWACYDAVYWAHDGGKGGLQFIKRKKLTNAYI